MNKVTQVATCFLYVSMYVMYYFAMTVRNYCGIVKES